MLDKIKKLFLRKKQILEPPTPLKETPELDKEILDLAENAVFKMHEKRRLVYNEHDMINFNFWIVDNELWIGAKSYFLKRKIKLDK